MNHEKLKYVCLGRWARQSKNTNPNGDHQLENSNYEKAKGNPL
jgi:hypothetical protein